MNTIRLQPIYGSMLQHLMKKRSGMKPDKFVMELIEREYKKEFKL